MDKNIVLIDKAGIELSFDNIVKLEFNSKARKEVLYFHYTLVKAKIPYLLLYDKNGKTNLEEFGNIKIDTSISLINSTEVEWTIIGKASEVWSKIYK